MGRYSSDSDSDRRSSSKKSKKKSKSKRRRSRSLSHDAGSRSRDSRRRTRSRTRSHSSDRSRRSRSREKRRRHRSRSEDSYRSRRSSRYSRSRSRTPRRHRSRTRSNSRERDKEYSRGKYTTRTRSRSRERSLKKKKKTKKHSRERSSSPKREKASSKGIKDPCESIPGFADMTLVQQSRLRIQSAFKIADDASTKEKITNDLQATETAMEQMDRAQVIDDIEEEDFMPSRFKSSRSNKTKEANKPSPWPTVMNLMDQENYHEMAIFGNSTALGLDEKTKKEISEATEKLSLTKRTIKWEERDLKTLAHPNLNISFEDAEKHWIDKLRSMRMEELKSRAL